MFDLNHEYDSIDYTRFITKKTIGEIRTFLAEIANGTSNYKSLHNLTEQVEHQYHGRFLIELIQNAHDALYEINSIESNNHPEDEGRIEVVVSNEPPFGALYLANDGTPFTPSNFGTLSRFGQSDKKPEKHIGNKGIGFRSVLEISREPEIYSRKNRSSADFDGFKFRFNPNITQLFVSPIQDLLDGNDNPIIEFGGMTPLVEWGKNELQTFRYRCQTQGIEDVVTELKFLSPYLLPEPNSSSKHHSRLKQFEQKGFATVIRLPFVNETAKSLALEKINELNENTAIFLNKAKSLWIETPDTVRFITREVRPLKRYGDAQQVDIEVLDDKDSCMNKKRYWLWEWAIGGSENLEELNAIRRSVMDLPGKWPDVRRAELALAVGVGEYPETGMISIFLPTEQTSGAACFLNAPFYGDISRTFVDLEQPFNKFIFEKLAEKALDIITRHLVGKEIDEARAVIDLICPLNHQEDDDNYWIKLIENKIEQEGKALGEELLMLTVNGWETIELSRKLPDCSELEIITDGLFYDKASFPVIKDGLLSRMEQIENLYLHYSKSVVPEPESIALTLEKIAVHYHKAHQDIDWNLFWHDVMVLLPQYKSAHLQEKKVLLGTDGRLYASNGEMSVFFRPRSSGDDEEVLSDRTVDDIPEELRSHIAFLNDKITVHVPREKGGIQNHPLHGYLSTGSNSLVQTFGVESILRRVLIPAIPKLPVALEGEKGRLCQAIISWGLRLVEGLVAKDKGEKTIQYLGLLPAPCQGGWYALNETSFGPGWLGTVGQELQSYLNDVDTPETKATIKRLLLPPVDDCWGVEVSESRELFEKAGAIDGMQLVQINPDEWESQFNVFGYKGFNLPEKVPPGFDSNIWEDYKYQVSQAIEPYYQGPFSYQIEKIKIFPGIGQFSSLTLDGREQLMKVLLCSIHKWNEDWKRVIFSKISGASHNVPYDSPLNFWFKETLWLIDRLEEPHEFKPDERWMIAPKVIFGQAHRFRHLHPIPANISGQLEANQELCQELEDLGMPVYRLEVTSESRRLLDDLSNALESPEEIANWDTYLGQVRSAWSLFEPGDNGVFPSQLIVRKSARFYAMTPSEEDPIFIPDDDSSLHHGLEKHVKYVLAIDSKDARRLELGFKEFYGNSVKFISELKVQPIVNKKPWEGGSEGDLFFESDLAWMIPILLSCHAYAGIQSRGPHTNAFSNAMSIMRRAKLIWADQLGMGLWEGGRCNLIENVDSVWIAKSSTLLVTESVRDEISKSAESISLMLSRADLEVPLRLVFNKLGNHLEPSREIIENTLQELKITPDQIREIEQILLGDLAWFIRLIRPILKLLHPHADLSDLAEITTGNALDLYLSQFDLTPFNRDQILSFIRKANRFYDLGLALFNKFGQQFQLNKWNQAMELVGEPPLQNSEASQQFQDIIDEVEVPIKSILRQILTNNRKVGSYLELIEKIETLSVPEDWSHQYWDIDFQLSMEIIIPVIKSWGASPEIIEAIEISKNSEELIYKLDTLKIEPNLDPEELFSDNQAQCLNVVSTLQKAGIFWCTQNNIPLNFWDCDTSDFLEYYSDDLDTDGYLNTWCIDKILSIFSKIPHDEQMNPLWDAIAESKTVDSLLKSINVKVKDLDRAEKQLDEFKDKAEKQKRIVDVCGKDFDNTEKNLSQLFKHIENEINDAKLPEVEVTNIAQLNELKERKRIRTGEPKKKRMEKPKGRMKQALKNLIGLAGEILAYRVLRKTYGTSVVSPGCWISENSRNKYSNNAVSDDFGCDFKIRHENKTYYIEVKASQGNDEVFELGISEIRRAIKTANKRKEKYLIFHVTDALSNDPKFQFLPNPYDRKFSKSYRIFNAGLKIQYQKA